MPRRFSQPKGPDDLIEYTFDFGPALPELDVIVGVDEVLIITSPDSDVVMNNGRGDLVFDGSLYSGATVSLWLSGGVVGRTYRISLSIMSAAGRILRRSADLLVADL